MEGEKIKSKYNYNKHTSVIYIIFSFQGNYHINKFELPPKNFPFQFNNVDYTGKSTVFLTGTKEKICELEVVLRSNKKSQV